MSSSIYTYVNSTGVIVADTTTIKATVQQEFLSALGQNLDIDDSAPAGVLIAGEVQARSAVVNNNAALANQINPNQSAGQFLDAIGGLTQCERTAQAQSYYPSVALVGSPDLPVPAGTQGKTTNGDIFATTAAIELDNTGNGSVVMQAVNYGAIAVPSGPLNIVSDVLGLTSLTAGTGGIVGNTSMSDVAFRSFRRQTLSLQGRSVNGALYSAVKNLPFVTDLQFLENNTAATVTLDVITLVAHSFWMCINGALITTGAANAAALAAVILQYKGTGSNWNGAQDAPASDPVTGQAFTPQWDVPAGVPLIVRATISQGQYTGTLTDNATNAILAYASNTLNGIEGLATGQNVSSFEIAGAVTQSMPGVYVKNLEIGTVSGGTYSNAEIAIALNEIGTLTSGNIDIVIV